MQIHSNAKSAGCYQLIDKAFFYDDVIDPAIVKEIQTFEKQYVPLLIRKIYRTPANTTVTKQYHVIGRIIHEPKKGYENAYVDISGPVPRWLEPNRKKVQDLRTLQGKWPGPNDEHPGSLPSREWIVSAPPPEVKPGWWLVEQLRAIQKYFDLGVQLVDDKGELKQKGTIDTINDKMQRILKAESERDEKIMAEAMEEARYRMRDNWPQMKRAIDEGRLAPPPQEKKPFVDLGHSEPPKG